MAEKRPRAVVGRQPAPPRLVEDVCHLAVDVELELRARAVADPDRLRALVAVEPRQLELEQSPLAGGAVHDLDVLRVAGDGAQEPGPPGAGLLDEAVADERGEREAGVAEPAVPVVPVPDAADLLRERGRRRGHDAARRGVRHRLQHHQRAEDGVGVAAAERAGDEPLVPVLARVLVGVVRRDRAGRVDVRREPGQHERNPLARLRREVRDGAQVLAAQVDRRAKSDRVRAGDRDPGVVLEPAHPGDDAAVVEADHELHPHRHAPLEPFDDPDDVRSLAARGHEVDHADAAVLGVEVELVHERVLSVPALDSLDLAVGREQPAAVLLVPQQRGEAGARVEAREAEPVDRAVSPDERRGLQVADQAVVLDPHHTPPVSERKRRFAARSNASS